MKTVALRSSVGEGRARSESILTRRARVANFIVDIANGMSMRAVAEKYGVHPNTVQGDLRWAEREGFFEKADDAVRHRLVPLAVDVLEAALKHHLITHDTDAALKILNGVRVLATGPSRSETLRETAEEIEEVTWERFMARRVRIPNDETAAPARAQEERAGGTPDDLPPIDAEVVQPGDSQEGDAPLEQESAGAGSGAETDGDLR